MATVGGQSVKLLWAFLFPLCSLEDATMTVRAHAAGVIELRAFNSAVNPSTPTVAIWVQLKSILCQIWLSRHLQFLTSGHSDAQP